MFCQNTGGLLFGLFACFIGLLGCQHASEVVAKEVISTVPAVLPQWITEKDQQCESDLDCVLVSADCCGCHQGGRQTAISKKALNKVAKARAYGCSETLCMQMLSKDASCRAKKAKCIAGVCALLN